MNYSESYVLSSRVNLNNMVVNGAEYGRQMLSVTFIRA